MLTNMHFLLCIVYFDPLSLWKIIGKFRFLKINKGEGQNCLVYFGIPANHTYFCCLETKKMKWDNLDIFDFEFIYLDILLLVCFIVAARVIATPKGVREIHGRKLRVFSFIQKTVTERSRWTRRHWRSLGT